MGLQLVYIHVIFSWTQIGRFGFSDREIGSQIGRFFCGKKYSILVACSRDLGHEGGYTELSPA